MMKNIAANAGCGCGWGMKERWLEEERRGFKYLLVLQIPSHGREVAQ